VTHQGCFGATGVGVAAGDREMVHLHPSPFIRANVASFPERIDIAAVPVDDEHRAPPLRGAPDELGEQVRQGISTDRQGPGEGCVFIAGAQLQYRRETNLWVGLMQAPRDRTCDVRVGVKREMRSVLLD
jgi:hypothetical protein